MNDWINKTVRHRSDPHGRNTGKVIGAIERWGHTLLRVWWESGVIETIHHSELVKK